MTRTSAFVPSWAVACAGSRDVAGLAASGALITAMSVAATPTAPSAPVAHVMRQRRLAGPWSEHQGRSVFADTRSVARKAEAHPRNVVMNDDYPMLTDDVWDPDPWRSRPG